MKLINTILLLFFVCILYAQTGSKSCSKPKFEDFDLNSISKCSTSDKKKSSNHYRKKKKKTGKNNLKLNQVLFSVVEEAPSFPKCKSVSNSTKKLCFNKEMKKHFSKNFYAERASDNGINGKVFIQFVINAKGNVTNLHVRGPKRANRLEQEVKRVISKLPQFTPGKQQGVPVNVKYSLPITFSAD